jgi:hypothetical protein
MRTIVCSRVRQQPMHEWWWENTPTIGMAMSLLEPGHSLHTLRLPVNDHADSSQWLSPRDRGVLTSIHVTRGDPKITRASKSKNSEEWLQKELELVGPLLLTNLSMSVATVLGWLSCWWWLSATGLSLPFGALRLILCDHTPVGSRGEPSQRSTDPSSWTPCVWRFMLTNAEHSFRPLYNATVLPVNCVSTYTHTLGSDGTLHPLFNHRPRDGSADARMIVVFSHETGSVHSLGCPCVDFCETTSLSGCTQLQTAYELGHSTCPRCLAGELTRPGSALTWEAHEYAIPHSMDFPDPLPRRQSILVATWGLGDSGTRNGSVFDPVLPMFPVVVPFSRPPHPRRKQCRLM